MPVTYFLYSFAQITTPDNDHHLFLCLVPLRPCFLPSNSICNKQSFATLSFQPLRHIICRAVRYFHCCPSRCANPVKHIWLTWYTQLLPQSSTVHRITCLKDHPTRRHCCQVRGGLCHPWCCSWGGWSSNISTPLLSCSPCARKPSFPPTPRGCHDVGAVMAPSEYSLELTPIPTSIKGGEASRTTIEINVNDRQRRRDYQDNLELKNTHACFVPWGSESGWCTAIRRGEGDRVPSIGWEREEVCWLRSMGAILCTNTYTIIYRRYTNTSYYTSQAALWGRRARLRAVSYYIIRYGECLSFMCCVHGS